MRCLLVALFWGILLIAAPVSAETLQAPVGGRSIWLGSARVGCGQPGGGWSLDASGRYLRPPLQDDSIGKPVELKIAADSGKCASAATQVTLVATGKWPQIDRASVVYFADEARVEARGRNLRGLALSWRSRSASGIDACHTPKLEPTAEHCSWNVGQGLPANPQSGALAWVPAGGRAGSDVTTFGVDGKPAPPETFVLAPARVILNHVLPPGSAIDLSSGRGEVPLAHADAALSVSCGAVRCEIAGGKLVVRGLSKVLNAVEATFKLVPNVFLSREAGLETQPTAHLAVLHCPMSVISGPVLRGLDSAQTVVHIAGRCAEDVSALRFLVEERPLQVVETQMHPKGADVLLRLGKYDGDTLTIVAVRREDQSNAVAIARTDTIAAPHVRTALELPGYPNIGFIPSNRPALVHLPKLGNQAYLEVLPVEGVYRVGKKSGFTSVQGDANAAGLTALSLGYRSNSLRGTMRNANLAVLTDPLQRGIHEANIPAPIDVSAFGPRPLIELVCSDEGKTFRVKPAETARVPFSARDNCRIVFHRERLSAEYGTQKLSLDIEVITLDGVSRGEGRVSQTVVLRSGFTPRLAWIRGVQAPFDRVIVRLSHAPDEAHYVGALEIPTGAPAVQWTMVLGTGRARLYAMTAIPTGLYRFGDDEHSGVLSLNFGIVSRLTWLDSEGREGLLGLEAGVMAFGLTNSKSTTGESLTQIGAVAGLGLSVPISNRSSAAAAAINLHGWLEMDITAQDEAQRDNRFAFIFGPSISIGNVGANL
jgi:hypothetical protein